MVNTVTLQTGMDVHGAGGDKADSISEVYENYVVIEKGFFFPQDYYIPLSAITNVDSDNRAHISVTKEEALNQRWEIGPNAYSDYSTTPINPLTST